MNNVQRDEYTTKILNMCLQELFQKNYFHKRIKEKPTRGIDAEQLLRIVIGEYRATDAVQAFHEAVTSPQGNQDTKTKEQQDYLQGLFGHAENEG